MLLLVVSETQLACKNIFARYGNKAVGCNWAITIMYVEWVAFLFPKPELQTIWIQTELFRVCLCISVYLPELCVKTRAQVGYSKSNFFSHCPLPQNSGKHLGYPILFDLFLLQCNNGQWVRRRVVCFLCPALLSICHVSQPMSPSQHFTTYNKLLPFVLLQNRTSSADV